MVAAQWYDGGQSDEGAIFVYHGSRSGLSRNPAWHVEGNQRYAHLGASMGTAGDVNADGYDDIVVGASHYDAGQEDEGIVYVYHGSRSGLGRSPAWTAEGNRVNGAYGGSVATAGDVNGDGYADVVVSAAGHGTGQAWEGRAYLYHGSPSGLSQVPAWTAEGNLPRANFGASVGTAGDVNGDGYDDLIVGATGYGAGQLGEGRTFVYHGSPSGLSRVPAWTAESNQEWVYFGWMAGTAGDVNGDGYDDVIVGAPYYVTRHADEGRAYVYHGSPSGLRQSPAWTAEGNRRRAWFGMSGGTAGDVNRDGYDDVIVGAPFHTTDQDREGRAYVYHGSPSGLRQTPAWVGEGNVNTAFFGDASGTAGDVNGDGYDDVIVGAPGYDAKPDHDGRAYVFYGLEYTTGLYLPTTHKRSVRYAPPCSAGNRYCEDHDTYQAAYGPLQPGASYRAYPDDRDDYYYLYLSAAGTVAIVLHNYRATGDLVLYALGRSGELERMALWGRGGAEMEIRQPLQSGVYYIQVYTAAGHGSTDLYTLRVGY
jgi:hypothetical protein